MTTATAGPGPSTPTPTTAPASAPAPVVSAGGVIVNSPTLLLGMSKRGKSSLLATAAEYVWETYGKLTHYYLADGGGMPSQMQALVNLGIVRVWRMRTRNAPGLIIETCQRASSGWWPTKINPKTGETKPDVRLVAPMTTKVITWCPEGHRMSAWDSATAIPAAIVCPTCRKTVTKGTNLKTTVETLLTKGFEQVGAYFYDGITSMNDWMMDDLAHRAGRNELGGEKGAIGSIASGSMTFGGNNRASYGFVQQRSQQMITNSQGIPGQVIPPIWTALTKEGSDEGGLNIVGPALAGNAATAVATSWFGNAIEVMIEEREGTQYRQMRLQPYTDKAGYRHLCGSRSFPGMLPTVLEDRDDAKEPFKNFSLKTFFLLLDQARASIEAAYAEKYTGAPGIAIEEMSFGSEEEAPAAPATVSVPQVARPAAPAVAKPVAGVAPKAAVPSAAPVAPKPVVPSPPSSAAPAPAPVSGGAPSSASPVGVVGVTAAAPAPREAAAQAPASAPQGPVAPPTVRPGPKPGTPTAAATPGAVPAPAAAAKPSAVTRPSPVATGPAPAQAPPAPKPPAKGPVAPPPGVKPRS